MKTPLLSLLSVASLFATSTAGAALVSNFTFDNTINSAIGGFTGSNANAGGTTYATGKFGQAVSLTSGTDAINLGSATLGAIGAGNFSISLWLNTNGATVGSDPAFFSNKNWNNGTNAGLNLNYNNSATSLKLNPAATTPVAERKDSTVTIGAGWNNLIIVRSGTSLAFYLNGILANTQTFTAGADFSSANNFFVGDDGAAGFYNNASSPGWNLPILIDDLAVYNTALTAGEITTLQTASASAVPEPSSYGLVGAGALAAVAMVRRRRKAV